MIVLHQQQYQQRLHTYSRYDIAFRVQRRTLTPLLRARLDSAPPPTRQPLRQLFAWLLRRSPPNEDRATLCAGATRTPRTSRSLLLRRRPTSAQLHPDPPCVGARNLCKRSSPNVLCVRAENLDSQSHAGATARVLVSRPLNQFAHVHAAIGRARPSVATQHQSPESPRQRRSSRTTE